MCHKEHRVIAVKMVNTQMIRAGPILHLCFSGLTVIPWLCGSALFFPPVLVQWNWHMSTLGGSLKYSFNR